MKFLFKEYTVKFKDSGHYYIVYVCQGFPKSKAFVSKSDKPNVGIMQPIYPLNLKTNTWKEFLSYYQYMAKRFIRQLKRQLVKKCSEKRCQSRNCCTGQGVRNHIR